MSEGANSCTAPLHANPIPTCFWYSFHKLLQINAQCRGHMPRAWTDPRIQKFSINLLRNTHLGAGGGMGQELVLKPPETDIFRHATSCGAAGYNKQNCHFRRKSPQCSRIAQQRVIRKSLWTWRLQSQHKWWFADGHHRIHSECGPFYAEHGLREHSSACQ